MPRQPRAVPLGPNGECDECGQLHHTRHGRVSCSGHITKGRHDPKPDAGRPCRRDPSPGLTRCVKHGASPKARAVGRRRVAEAKVETMARKLIPDPEDRTPIRNPLERLLELASEADAFRESLRRLANDLDGQIRYQGQGGAAGEQLRAEVATYRAALRDVTDMLVAIAKLDIESMLARIEARKVDLVFAALTQGLDEARLDDEQKRAVMNGVGRHLRAVRGPAA